MVGSASCGIAIGARAVEDAARRAVEQLGLDAVVSRTGCIGFCSREPLLDLVLPGGPRVSYGEMTPEKTRGLLAAYASRGDLQPELALGCFRSEEHVSTGEVHKHTAGPEQLRDVPEWSSLDFYRRQKKVILRNCGSIDPMDISEAVARGTYRGAVRAMYQMTPDEVIEEVRPVGSPRPRRRGLSHRTEMATGPPDRGRRQVRGLQRGRRASPAPTWTAPCWRAIPMPSSRACSSAPTPSGPARASSTSATSIRWPSKSSSTPSTRPRSAACWATTSSAADGRSASRCGAGQAPISAAKKPR